MVMSTPCQNHLCIICTYTYIDTLQGTSIHPSFGNSIPMFLWERPLPHAPQGTFETLAWLTYREACTTKVSIQCVFVYVCTRVGNPKSR